MSSVFFRLVCELGAAKDLVGARRNHFAEFQPLGRKGGEGLAAWHLRGTGLGSGGAGQETTPLAAGEDATRRQAGIHSFGIRSVSNLQLLGQV